MTENGPKDQHKVDNQMPVHLSIDLTVDLYLTPEQCGLEDIEGDITPDQVLDTILKDREHYGSLTRVLVSEWDLIESDDFEVSAQTYNTEKREWTGSKTLTQREAEKKNG